MARPLCPPRCAQQAAAAHAAPAVPAVLITLGPSCQSVETLVEMLEAGVTCARIDLTWGTMEFHRRALRNLATAMRQTRRCGGAGGRAAG